MEKKILLKTIEDQDTAKCVILQELNLAKIEIDRMKALKELEEIQTRDIVRRQFLDKLQATDSANAMLAEELKIKLNVEDALRDTVASLENNVKSIAKKLGDNEEARRAIGGHCRDLQGIMQSRSQSKSPMKDGSGDCDSFNGDGHDKSAITFLREKAYHSEMPTPRESEQQIERLCAAFIETLAQLDALQQQSKLVAQSLQQKEAVEVELRSIVGEYGAIVNQQKSDFKQQNDSMKQLLAAQSERECRSQRAHNDEVEKYTSQIKVLSEKVSSLERICAKLEVGFLGAEALRAPEVEAAALSNEHAALKVSLRNTTTRYLHLITI